MTLPSNDLAVRSAASPRSARLLRGAARHDHERHRPERRRKDDRIQCDHRLSSARRWPHHVRGRRSTGLRPSAIARRGIVRTFQKTSVFPALSVDDNVLTGLHLRATAGFFAVLAGRRRLAGEERALADEAAAIIEFVGLGHRRREAASGLPYGEQRLVELAVALAARPRMLLLDEPGAGMTGAEKVVVSGLIRRCASRASPSCSSSTTCGMVMGISDTRDRAQRRPRHRRGATGRHPGESRGDPRVSRGVGWPGLSRLHCSARARPRRLRPDQALRGLDLRWRRASWSA